MISKLFDCFKTFKITITTTFGVGLFFLSLILAYLIYLFIYGLFICPTRHIPGPFVTRFTRLYYDFCLLGGNLSKNVHRLHGKYGYFLLIS